MLRAGVLGCGKSSQEYQLPAIAALEGVEIAWVCDLDAARARAVAEEYDVPFYDDPSAAIEDTPDTVHVNTPPFTHRDLAIEAMEAGAHALVEKPMAMDVTECDEMADAAERTGRKLGVVHNNLYFDPMLAVMRAVERGEYGDIVSVGSFLGGSPDPGTGREWTGQVHGGRVGDRLPHPIYLVTHFLPDADVSAIRTVEKADGDLHGVNVQLDTPSAFGDIQVHESAKPSKTVYLVGEERIAYLDLFNYAAVEYRAGERSPVSIVRDNVGAAAQLVSDTAKNVLGYAKSVREPGDRYAGPGHYNLIREWNEAVRNDGPVPIPPAEGRRVVDLLTRIEDHSKESAAPTVRN
jgi:predicted dehydrogenase